MQGDKDSHKHSEYGESSLHMSGQEFARVYDRGWVSHSSTPLHSFGVLFRPVLIVAVHLT